MRLGEDSCVCVLHQEQLKPRCTPDVELHSLPVQMALILNQLCTCCYMKCGACGLTIGRKKVLNNNCIL